MSGTNQKAFPGLDRQRAQVVDAMTDEHEPGIRGIEFFVGLLDNEALHIHPRSEFV